MNVVNADVQRNDNISIAKGIGIIMMVLGHTHFSRYGNAWVSMVHMPLFFFFSGYCFKEKYIGHFLTFVQRRIKGIYWPSLKWGLLFLALHNIFFHLNLYADNTSYLYTGHDFLKKAFFIATTMTQYEELLGGYWFMRTLFWCTLLGYGVIRFNFLSPIFRLVILLVASVFILRFGLRIPYFDVGARELLACSFFMAGYVYQKSRYKFELFVWIIPIALFLVSLGTIYWQASMGWFQSMTWWKAIPWFFTALIGIFAIYAISVRINKHKKISKAFAFVGEHTLVILTWHLLCFKLVSCVIVSIYNVQVRHMADFPVIDGYSSKGWWIVYLLIGCGLPILLVLAKKICKKKC